MFCFFRMFFSFVISKSICTDGINFYVIFQFGLSNADSLRHSFETDFCVFTNENFSTFPWSLVMTTIVEWMLIFVRWMILCLFQHFSVFSFLVTSWQWICYVRNHQQEVFVRQLRLTLSWRRPLSYKNQSIDLQSKSMDCFLYDIGLHHESVKPCIFRVANCFMCFFCLFLIFYFWTAPCARV